VSLIKCGLKTILGVISLKYSYHFLSLPSLPHKMTYIQTVLRQKRSQIWIFRCRFFFPMPHLTPDCDRVIVLGVPPSDGMEYNALFMVKMIQLVMEIRISEDYCLSDILIADYGNVTPRHVTKITPQLVKNYELCAFVSSTYICCVNKDNRFWCIVNLNC